MPNIDKFSMLCKYKDSKVSVNRTYKDMINAIEKSKMTRSSTELVGTNYPIFKTLLTESYANHENRKLDWMYIKYSIKYKLSDEDAMHLLNKINEAISNDNAYYPNKFTSLCIVKRSLDESISNTYFMIYIPFYDPTSLRRIRWSSVMLTHFVCRVEYILSKCINTNEVSIDEDNIIRLNTNRSRKPFGLAYMTQEERNNLKVEYSPEEEW